MVMAADMAKGSNWAVITTINPPTPTIRKLAAMPDWNVVVVGDLKTPLDWACENVTYLGPDAQRSLGYRITDHLSWNSYARKNVGYVYAISRGASVVYETDDDNLLVSARVPLLPESSQLGAIRAPASAKYQRVVNPYAAFGAPTVWPRGYPLRAIAESRAVAPEPLMPTICAVQQQLADADPDVDAIFRLTRAMDVGHIAFNATAPPVAISKGSYTPWNSQNTVFISQSLWSLLLPSSTPFRVCDIWRSYFAQRLLWALGASVCFMGPTVRQDRNPHDLYDDFFDEMEIYRDAERLIEALERWTLPKGGSLKEAILALWRFMSEEGFIGDSDVALAEAWVADLDEAGYAWPAIATPHAGRRVWSTDLHTAADIEGDVAPDVAVVGTFEVVMPQIGHDSTDEHCDRDIAVANVVITGISGMIGSQVAIWLVSKGGYAVHGLVRWRSNLRNLSPVLDRVTLHYGDVLDASCVRQLITKAAPEYLFHFAAQAINRVGFDAPRITLDVNVIGTLNVVQALVEFSPNTTLMLAGSSTEYGAAADEAQGAALNESTPMMPVSPYGASKVAAEHLANAYSRSHHLRVVTARIFNQFAPGGTEAIALQEFARQVAMIERGLQPPVLKHGNLETQRDFSDVRDTAPLFVELAKRGESGHAYNVASGIAFSTREQLELMVSLANTTVPIRLELDSTRLRPYDEAVLVGDSSKLQRLTGWRPNVNLTRTAMDVLEFWRDEVRARYSRREPQA